MKANLSRLGGQLGVGLCVAGFLLVFLGWNGAASNDLVVEQFPYLLSGGVSGLCLVVIGVGMIVVQNQRADRAALQASLDGIREALERGGGGARSGIGSIPEDLTAGLVVAGRSSYHQPDCHLVKDRDEAVVLTLEEAAAQGLEACRVCQPAEAPTAEAESDEGEPTPRREGRQQLRARNEEAGATNG